MKSNKVTWVRLLLALVAVLVVGGPSLVLAGGGTTYVEPSIAQILGPASVHSGSKNTPYQLKVTFKDGSSSIVDATSASAVNGSFTPGTPGSKTILYSNSSGTRDGLKATYVGSKTSVTATKIITIQ